jgi:hypothetical protein
VKRITAMFSLAVTLMLPAVHVLAEGPDQKTPEATQKDECLLILRNCEMQADSLQRTIQRLNEEIAKGTKVYSAEELKKLEKMLDDANRTLDLLLNDKETLGM